MISAIMQIGNWCKKNKPASDPINDFIQNPNEKGNIHKVFTIILNQANGKYLYDKINVEEFTETKIYQYLYRRGSARGADITPTSKFAGDMEKTFNNKILKSISDIEKDVDAIGLDTDEKETIVKIKKILSNESEKIINSLKKLSEDLAQNEGCIVTLVFIKNGEKHYIGDLDLFKKVLISKAKEKYYNQYGKKALGNHQFCSVCHEKKQEVYGFVNTYNFYTVDKPGFVTGGFRQQDAWKNYPVCYDCATKLELGKKYLSENMSFSFYGFKYLLIPKFLNRDLMEETLEIMEDAYEQKASEILKASFEKKYIYRLTSAETEIFDLIKEYDDYISYDLLFYAEKQAAFNILLHVEDMLPSRFKGLFEIKACLDEIDIFKKQKKDGKRQVIFNFGILRDFFPQISKKRTYDKHFLELAGKIFSLKPIDYHFIMQAIVNKLRSVFVNNRLKDYEKKEKIKNYCLRGYLLLNFLSELGVLTKGGIRMDVKIIEDLQDSFYSEDKSMTEKIERFFEAHSGFFDSAPKKACFLVGMLVQKLLNIQWKDKGATPFRNKLQGLRLNEALIKSISKNAQDKLEQYKKNYYKKLETVISQFMVAGGSNWKITNDEISFFFTTGMNLAGLFKTKKEEEQNDGTDE